MVQALTFQLMLERNVLNHKDLSEDEKISKVEELTHVRLDRETINRIDNLELLGTKVTNLYLQHNSISVIENLECLPNLTFLVLSGNKIKKIENLNALLKLKFLDLSENVIEMVNCDALPRALMILNLKKNPCTYDDSYRRGVLDGLPQLKQLDGKQIEEMERVKNESHLLSDEESDEESEEEEPVAVTNANDEAAASSKATIEDGKEDSFTEGRPFHSLTTGILLRSQTRMESSLSHFKHREKALESVKRAHTEHRIMF